MWINLVSLALFVTAIIYGWVQVFKRIRAIPPSGIVCGQCGSPAAKLVDFQCPACGSDVRSVGLIEAPSSTIPVLAHALLAMVFTLSVTVVAVTIMGAFHRESVECVINGKLIPNSFQNGDLLNGLQDVRYRMLFQNTRGDFTTGSIVFTADCSNGTASDLYVRMPSLEYRVDQVSTAGVSLTRDAVVRWLKKAGVRGFDADLTEFATQLFDPVEAHAKFPTPMDNEFFSHPSAARQQSYVSGSGADGRSVSPVWVTAGLPLFAAGTWLFILKKHLWALPMSDGKGEA